MAGNSGWNAAPRTDRPSVAPIQAPPIASPTPPVPTTPAAIDIDKIVSQIVEKLATDPRFKGPTGERGPPGEPGPKGDKGDPGEQGIAGINGKDATVDIDSIVAAVLERLPKQPPQPTSETHIVVVADRGAGYWARLAGEVKAAQEVYGGIEVTAPPQGFAGALPQIVQYENGVPRVLGAGYSQVSSVLSRVSRGDSL